MVMVQQSGVSYGDVPHVVLIGNFFLGRTRAGTSGCAYLRFWRRNPMSVASLELPDALRRDGHTMSSVQRCATDAICWEERTFNDCMMERFSFSSW